MQLSVGGVVVVVVFFNGDFTLSLGDKMGRLHGFLLQLRVACGCAWMVFLILHATTGYHSTRVCTETYSTIQCDFSQMN